MNSWHVRARLLRAAVCVGSLLVTLGCQDATDAPSGQISALTYNVKGLPSAITGWDTGGQMDKIAPLLNGFELVGLQEDFIEGNHERLLSASTHAHKDWFSAKKVDPNAPGQHNYGSGLSLLARWQVEETAHAHFASCVGIFDHASDCLASKGVMVSRMRLGPEADAVIDVYNTHMEAGGGQDDHAVRKEQVEQIVSLMNTYSKDRAVLFMGDTNLHPDDAQDAGLIELLDQGAGLREVCSQLSCDELNHIDRFHVRGSSRLELVPLTWRRAMEFVDADGQDLSDHPAIAATFSWRLLQP